MSEPENIPNQYARSEHLGSWVYDFRCPACGSCGQLGVPKEATLIRCPEGPPNIAPGAEIPARFAGYCMAEFKQWQPSPARPVMLSCLNVREARFAATHAREQAEAAAHWERINGKIRGR